MQYRAMVGNPQTGSKGCSGRKSKSSRRTNRLYSSAEKIKLEFPVNDPSLSDLRACIHKRTKGKLQGMATQPSKEFMPECSGAHDSVDYDLILEKEARSCSEKEEDFPC